MHRKQKGFTLIELIIIVVVTAIVAIPMSKIMLSSTSAIINLYTTNKIIRDARGFYNYFDYLVKNNAQILAANANSITIQKGSDSFDIFAHDFASGTPPYTIGFQKNSGAIKSLGKNIAQLSGPNRPGIEFIYLDARKQVTATLSEIRMIDLTLTFTADGRLCRFNTSFALEGPNSYIQTF